MDDHCYKCERKLNPDTAVWFELSFLTSKWYRVGECPPGESQGCFPFGPDCAKRIKVEETQS